MSDLNINDLPPEILAKLFGFLDMVNSKNATLTCKLWKNLIESTCRWSFRLSYEREYEYKHGKLRSRNQNSAEQKIKFILTTNRKFGKIEIEHKDTTSSDKDNQLYQIFKRHGSNVVKLTFLLCHFDNLAQLLNFTPNLEHATIEYSSIASDVPSDQVLPNLKKLKHLKILGDGKITKCFRNAKLTSMEIRNVYHDEEAWENCNACNSFVDDFLSSQHMLTSLTVDSGSSPILIEMGKLKVPIPFRLTQLNTYIDNGATSGDHDNFLRFFNTQAESLTELRIGSDFRSSVYECIFTSMPKLNTLAVSTDGIPQDNDFYEQLKENCSIRTLQLMDSSYSNEFVADFLKKLPNIRHLILPFSENVNTLATAAQNLKQLESLSLHHFNEHLIGNASFPNLKTLHMGVLDGKFDWNEFTKTHSRLAELTIERMGDKSYLTSNDIDQITTNADLQHITLGVGFVVDERFFEIVRSKCTNLKTLDLKKSCIPHGLNCNVGINVLRLYDFRSCNTFWALWSE